METNRLLLLGLLKSQEQHGYQLMDFVERNLANLHSLKKATAYYELKRMEEQGLVSVRIEQDEGRPPRRVYAMTEAGEASFADLMRECLRDADPLGSATLTGLMFLDHLAPDECGDLLAEKVDGLKRHLVAYERAPSHGPNSTIDLAIQHVRARLAMEITWYEKLIVELQQRNHS